MLVDPVMVDGDVSTEDTVIDNPDRRECTIAVMAAVLQNDLGSLEGLNGNDGIVMIGV